MTTVRVYHGPNTPGATVRPLAGRHVMAPEGVFMRARLLPVRFPTADDEFEAQLARLRDLLGELVDILEPVELGTEPLPESEAAVFPQLLGDAFRHVEALRALDRPRLVLTSEFGTMSMWDWEIGRYLAEAGVDTYAPYELEQARTLCRALGLRRELAGTRFVVFQDDPGDGMQASIFKRFYWWEDECTARILERFGVRIERRSFAALGREAKSISDAAADAAYERWRGRARLDDLPERNRRAALKLYLAIKAALGDDPAIQGAGLNCLNESFFSDSTPCLAWNLLYEERGLTWGCEADTVSMLTQLLLHRSLNAPLMMTNLYPFLMGQAALKHERIAAFPDVSEPEHHVLVAHCGYLGVLPTSMAESWTLREKVLAIVDDDASAIDARMAEGPVTLAKLSPSMATLTVVEGELVGYAQYPGSDCLNGGVVRVPNGHALMERVPSHHAILVQGHRPAELRMLGRLFDLEIETVA